MSGNQGFPLIGPPKAALLTFPPLGLFEYPLHGTLGGFQVTRVAAEMNSAALATRLDV
jgi:hypothetical protein